MHPLLYSTPIIPHPQFFCKNIFCLEFRQGLCYNNYMINKLRAKLKIKSTKVFWALAAAFALALVFALAAFADARRGHLVVIEGVDIEAHYVLPPVSDAPAPIVIHISGQVQNPGVFTFYEGAIVWAAVEAAGGLLPDADQNATNMARRLRDEDHVIIFALPQGALPSGGTTTGPVGDTRININTATAAELQALNGIGPSRAENIIRHRDARGGFDSIEELMNVSGIGESIFESIRDNIRIN